MLRRLLIAVLVGIVTGLVCYLIGLVLVSVNQTAVINVGHFLEDISALVGLIGSVWFYLTGSKIV